VIQICEAVATLKDGESTASILLNSEVKYQPAGSPCASFSSMQTQRPTFLAEDCSSLGDWVLHCFLRVTPSTSFQLYLQISPSSGAGVSAFTFHTASLGHAITSPSGNMENTIEVVDASISFTNQAPRRTLCTGSGHPASRSTSWL
jgi:hypothetical protein